MITLEDLAKKLNLSTSTVSRALNNNEIINIKTRERVQKLAKELNYTPNASAQSLVNKRANTIGVVYEVEHGLNNLFFAAVLESFKRSVQEKGYDILLLSNNTENKMDFLSHSISKNVDSVLIVSYGEAPYESIKKLQESNLAVITLDPHMPQNNSIYSDSYNGIISSCNYLYDLGHRKIGFINGSYINFIGKERLRGYLDFIRSKNLTPIYIDDKTNESYDFNDGYSTMKAIVDKFGLPEAICSSSDLMALGAISYLRKINVKIPEDLSIVGFDDLSVSEITTPKLTTVAQDYESIGKKASDLLYDMMTTGNREVAPQIIKTKLVIRESCKKR